MTLTYASTEIHSSDPLRWLEVRATGIGASEIAAVLGLSRWGDAGTVYAAKIAPAEQLREEWLEWGHALEGVIAQRFASSRYAGGSAVVEDSAELSGWLLRSREHGWALATVDAWVHDIETGLTVPLEIKTSRSADDWESGVPAYYAAQVQQQMLVTGAPCAYVACLVGGSRLLWDRVVRDEHAIRQIITAGAELWQRVVERRPPPSEDHAAIARMYAADYQRQSEIELGEEELRLANEREDLLIDARAMKVRIDKIDAKLKQAIGSFEIGVLPDGGRYSYATRRDGVRVLRRKK